MMNVAMSSDVTEYEPRLLFNMTKRELICGAVGAFMGYGLFKLLGVFELSLTVRVISAVILAFPILCIGRIKPFNLPLEVFFFKCFLPLKLNPTKKYYRSVGVHNFPKAEQMYRDIPKKRMNRKQRLQYEKTLKEFGAAD